jgi:hypothetical protein
LPLSPSTLSQKKSKSRESKRREVKGDDKRSKGKRGDTKAEDLHKTPTSRQGKADIKATENDLKNRN